VSDDDAMTFQIFGSAVNVAARIEGVNAGSLKKSRAVRR